MSAWGPPCLDMTQPATGSATSSWYEEAAVSLHDTDRAGCSLSCPTSQMSLASGLPRGQGGAGGDGVTWPLAGHSNPSPPRFFGIFPGSDRVPGAWAGSIMIQGLVVILFRIRIRTSIYLALTVCKQCSTLTHFILITNA